MCLSHPTYTQEYLKANPSAARFVTPIIQEYRWGYTLKRSKLQNQTYIIGVVIQF